MTLPRFLLVISLGITTCLEVYAQPQELVAEFEQRSHTFEGFTLPYRLYVPDEYDGARPHPLIVTFHGAGERGNNNTSQIAVHRIATAWADYLVQSRHSPFVVSPQVPSGGRWEDVIISNDGRAPIRREMSTVLDLLDSLAIEFNIDADRVYATGLSLGGYGTFDVVYRDPSRFAAAMPMSGGYSPLLADSIGNVPMWIIHGETDGTVPPWLSKNMVTAFEANGRGVLYTNCDYFTCNALSPEELDEDMRTRPDLVFMGVPNVGHGPWAPWYDDQRIQEWLLSKHRLTDGLVSIVSPGPADRVEGMATIEWTGGEATDSVEIMFSRSVGSGWQRVGERTANSGSYTVDTSLLPDTPLGRFEVVLIDGEGFPYAKTRTESFTVDNEENAVPIVEVIDLAFRTPASIMLESMELPFRAGDAESTELAATLSYSADGGATFSVFDEFMLGGASDSLSREVNLADLPNAEIALLRLEISDGVNVGVDRTPAFRKATQRLSSSFVEHTVGSSSAKIRINFVDEGKLTGHRYRVTFEVPDGMPKTYSVHDLDLEVPVPVLSDVPITGSEGPEFDGIRLVVTDVDVAEPDRDRTGWTVGDVTMGVSVRAPRVTLGGQQVESLATPADYRLTVFQDAADTTSSLFDFTPVPIRFVVENLTVGARRDVLFDDTDQDGLPSHGERLYILEEGPDQQVLPAWMLTFVRGPSNIGPDTGDVFELITLKPATEQDVYEFVGMIGVSSESDAVSPAGFRLGANYPNPFSGRTNIPYSIELPAKVSLTVHDVLGRVVAMIDRGVEQPGDHTAVFEMNVASGVYFVRLSIDAGGGTVFSSTNRMLVLR